MHILLGLILACVVFGFIATAVVCLVTWHTVHRFLETRRQNQLERLTDYHSRLRLSVSKMLSRANEIDQEAKYLSSSWSERTKERYTKALEGLVLLGESLVVIEKSFESKQLKKGEWALLRSCRVAIRLSEELDAVESETVTISLESASNKDTAAPES